MNNISRTDWSRIDAMTDDDIDTSDIPPLTDEFFAKAKLRLHRQRAKRMNSIWLLPYESMQMHRRMSLVCVN